MAAYPGTASYGISRDCSVGGTSEHKEGRAWDWANDATTPAGRRRVANFMRWLFATDPYGHRHAMARRLGVMYIIWNRRIFRMYRANEGWTPYTGSSPHTDHVHVSLTRPGGNKRTSFWTMQMDGPRRPAARRPAAPPTRAPGPSSSRPSARSTVTYDFAERGDFDGNGKLDILWYGQGGKPESIWWGRRGRGFVQSDMTVRGSFRPLTGDYDGDGRTDILWYAPGDAQDSIWYGRGDRTWDTAELDIATRFPKSMVGDFDGDGRDDIFWYAPGAGADKVWYGRADRRFVVEAIDDRRAPTARRSATSTATAATTCSGTPRRRPRTTCTSAAPTGRSTPPSGPSPSTPGPSSATSTATARDDLFWYVRATARTRSGGVGPTGRSRSGAVDNVSGTYSPSSPATSTRTATTTSSGTAAAARPPSGGSGSPQPRRSDHVRVRGVVRQGGQRGPAPGASGCPVGREHVGTTRPSAPRTKT